MITVFSALPIIILFACVDIFYYFLGRSLRPSVNLLERFYYGRDFTTFKHQKQNRSGIISVIANKEGDDVILGGGTYDGRFNTDLVNNRNMIDRAYMMSALHLQAKDVLEIGLSSGSWAKVIASHDIIEKLDIIEMNPGYLDIIRHYPEQESILNDPKVNIIIDDGRRWLKRHPNRKYDFIIMNVSFYWRDQATNILSVDFLEICKSHLNPGGVIYYNTTDSWDIPYTAASVFKYVVRYSNFIAVSDSPFPNDNKQKKANLLKYSYHGKPIRDYQDPQLVKIIDQMATFYLSNKRSDILAKRDIANLITDDNLASEFKTTKKIYSPSRNWLQLLGL